MPIRFGTFSAGQSGRLFSDMPPGRFENVTLVLSGTVDFYPDGATQLILPTSGVVRLGLLGRLAEYSVVSGSMVAYTDPLDSKQRLGANASGLEQ